MIDLYFASVILFFALLAVLIYKDRKNIDYKYVLFMRRTKRFRDTLDAIAKKSILFWKIVGTIAFIFCLFFMFYGTFSMFDAAYKVSQGVIKEPALQLALPTPFQNMVVGPGYIGIPFWFWIIAISLILIPHESFHGIIARAEKIKLKDVGLLLLAIFPGAFVEPDEKQLEKSKLITKLRIFSAGSFINIALGITIVLLAQQFLWAPNVSGIMITSVDENSPASQAGLQAGMVLDSVDGRDMDVHFLDYSFVVLMVPASNTKNVAYDISYLLLGNALSYRNIGDTFTVTSGGSSYDITIGENPENSERMYIGFDAALNAKDYGMFNVLFPLLGLSALLSILVGIFNIMPIYPLDGGLIVKSLTDKVFKKKTSNNVTMAITFIMLAVIIYSVVGPFF